MGVRPVKIPVLLSTKVFVAIFRKQVTWKMAIFAFVLLLRCFPIHKCCDFQVYIVTMEQEKEQRKQKHSMQQSAVSVGGDDVDDDENQEFGDYVATDGESLLSLVQPEMKMLSQHWLAALKDHALLSLPPGMMFPLVSSSK